MRGRLLRPVHKNFVRRQLDRDRRLSKESDLDETISEVVINGELAAVSVNNCDNNISNCDLGTFVHVFRRAGASWSHEGRIPKEGSFEHWAFDMQLAEGTMAIATGGIFGTLEAAQNDYIYFYERESTGWEGVSSIGLYGDALAAEFSMAFDGNLLILPVPPRQNLIFETPSAYVYRRTGSGWNSGYITDSDGDLSIPWRAAAILSPGLVGVTARDYRSGCIRAKLYQSLVGWEEAGTLESGYCGDEPRKVVFDAASRDAAMGSSPSPGREWYEIPGSVRVFSVPDIDCDYSGVADLCEINDGILDDCNLDGAADVCQPRAYIDYDLDLSMTLRDVAGLQNCFTGASMVGPCCGVFDYAYSPAGIDLIDLRAFVGAMTGP